MKARVSIIIAAGAVGLIALLGSEASAKGPRACDPPTTRVCQKWATVGGQRRCVEHVCEDKDDKDKGWITRRR